MTLTLLLRYWRFAALAGLIGAALGWLHEHDQRVAEHAVSDVVQRRTDSIIAAVKPQLAQAETVYVQTTKTVQRTIARIDTLRDTVLAHLTDTVIVKQFVAASDSSIRACTELVSSCADTKRLLTIDRDAWKAKALAIPVARPTHYPLVAIASAVLGGIGGYLVPHHR